MQQRIRPLLLFEAATFLAAALVHFGALFDGHKHRQAGIAESLLGTVLLAGFGLTWLRPVWRRDVGIAVQGFALLGTLVGLFTIAVGVGPRTLPDVVYHIGILTVLGLGLFDLARTPATGAPERHPHSA